MIELEPTPALHLDPVLERSVDTLPRPIGTFLDAWGARFDRPATLDAYLDEVWPGELPSTFVAANAAIRARQHYEVEVGLRPFAFGPTADRSAVGSTTLALRAFRRQGKLVVHRVDVVPHVMPRSYERAFQGVVSWRPDRFMPPEALELLACLPERRRRTRERLEPWRTYLGWRLRRLDAERVVRPVTGITAGSSKEDVVVRLDRLDGLSLGMDVVLLRREGATISLGDIVRLDPSKRSVVVRPPRPAPVLALENLDECSLATGQAADRRPLEIQRSGLERLEHDRGHTPELADYLFDAAAASPTGALVDLPPLIGGNELNEDQRAAVQKALQARELCLIQGPPGTGKTTVIAEICLRSVLAGRRVLVASQTNLAVDNALARLVSRPEVRALRIAKEERVDEDFKHLLPDRAVQAWLEKVEDATKVVLAEHDGRREQARRRREAVDDLQEATDARGRAERALHDAQEIAGRRGRAVEASRAQYEVACASCSRMSEDRRTFAALLRWLDGAEGPIPRIQLDHDTTDALGLGPTPLRALERARGVAPRLDDLERLLLELPRGGEGVAVTDEARAELQALRLEKARLVESIDDDESRRLPEINRRLRQLETTAYAQLAKRLHQVASEVFDDETASLRELVSALAWSKDLDGPLATLREELASARSRVQASERAVGVLRESTERRLEQLRDEEAAHVRKRDEVERELDAAERMLREAIVELEGCGREQASADQRVRAAQLALQRLQLLRGGSDDGCEPAAMLRDARQALDAAEAEERAQSGEDELWRAFREGWLQQLAAVSASDRAALVVAYTRRANVVGVTCHEAGKPQFWSEPSFRPFDVVIIDEVSKATPLELVLPMLVGRKTILVGDHRQLPPMFRERDCTFEGAVEEQQIEPSELESFRKLVTSSLFEELYRGAHDSIRHSLRTQYRMHPVIMEVVNEVYDGHLLAGGGEQALATARRHGLDVRDARGGPFIQPEHAFVWIDSSRDLRGERVFEAQVGSSKENQLEVELVCACLERLNAALAAHGYLGRTTHVVSAPTTAHELVASSLVPSALAAELFRERRIRCDGRSVSPETELPRGATVDIDARKDVGVISFYGAQLRAIRRAIGQTEAASDVPLEVRFPALDLRTDTVDRFQGMERSIVIASLVRATPRRLSAFASDYRRVNVAFSRARELLVVTGASETWARVPVEIPDDDGMRRTTQLYGRALDIARLRGGFRTATQLLRRDR